jgi:hypothetical protein
VLTCHHGLQALDGRLEVSPSGRLVENLARLGIPPASGDVAAVGKVFLGTSFIQNEIQLPQFQVKIKTKKKQLKAFIKVSIF